ncbi:MAG: hypothetical protein COA58_10660 [Bacteroidetes bacterium]|nr:MAG: hypothetical protein COA58_10660 [Bacteroidota bacterium]
MENETSVTSKLSSSLNRRDEIPNLELAKSIINDHNQTAIEELIENLNHKNKAIQNDCIKVLYEIGNTNPQLISSHAKEFVRLLESKNNRIQWGSMTALSTITLENPSYIFSILPQIIKASERGSVITKDQAINILIKVCSIEKYADNTFTLLNEQLLKSPINQLPMYAERASSIIKDSNRKTFVDSLETRLPDFEKETKRKRVEKVLKLLNQE